MIRIALYSLLLSALLLARGVCAGDAPTSAGEFAAGGDHPLRSILVLPPLNLTKDSDATYTCLSTVSRPLAERGYYVFPVAEIDQYLKANGMPTAVDMRQIPLDKVVEIIGADAVLFLEVRNYDTSAVTLSGQLVDARSAAVLWTNLARVEAEPASPIDERDPHNLWDFLGELAVDIAIGAVEGALTDKTHELCGQASQRLFSEGREALPYGPYHPKHVG